MPCEKNTATYFQDLTGYGWICDMTMLTSVFNAKFLTCQETIRLKQGFVLSASVQLLTSESSSCESAVA